MSQTDPQSSIKFSEENKGELFQEIRKCFGTIGSYNHGTMLNDATFQRGTDDRKDTLGKLSVSSGLLPWHVVAVVANWSSELVLVAAGTSNSGTDIKGKHIQVKFYWVSSSKEWFVVDKASIKRRKGKQSGEFFGGKVKSYDADSKEPTVLFDDGNPPPRVPTFRCPLCA
eukprot:COSAG01_NODE_3228_length_6383_cov_16.960216_3_plen_170_part_00